MTKRVLIRSPYNTDLPWSEDLSSLSRLFLVILLFLMLFALITWKVMNTTVPEVAKKQKEKLPDRLVELVVERTKRPEPPPVKLPKKKEVAKAPTPQEKPIDKPPEKIVREERPIKPTEQEIEQAREVATQVFQEEVGEAFEEVTAVRSEVKEALAGLGGLIGGDFKVGGSSGGSSGGDDIVSSGAGSGGISGIGRGGASGSGVASSGSGYGRGSGSGNGTGTRYGSGGTVVKSTVASAQPSSSGSSSAASSSGGRSNASVRAVIQRYGARFDSIYRRALRQDAGLEGNIVLQLTIAPDGSVSSVSISSSDITDDTMISKLKARIQGINFGPADAVWTGPYTLRFFPQ